MRNRKGKLKLKDLVDQDDDYDDINLEAFQKKFRKNNNSSLIKKVNYSL